MRYILFFLFIMMISSLASCSNPDAFLSNKIEIHYVNTLTEKLYSVDCSEFEKRFDGFYYKSILLKEREIQRFLKSLNSFNNRPLPDVGDIKMKAYVYYLDGHIDTICMNNFGDFWINNNYVGQSDSLLLFITQNCKNFGWSPTKN